MMIYLTGATTSAKVSEAPQTDTAKSLGGYISSTPVPNSSVNALFDLISMQTIKDKQKETIALGLVNKLDVPVYNVDIKLLTKKDNVCKFKVAAVNVDDNLQMEHIINRYAEPMQAEFVNVDFYRAMVEVEITNPGVQDEVINFDPFDVDATLLGSGIEATWEAIKTAFSASENYSVRRITEKTFVIESKHETDVVEPVDCECLCSDEAVITFKGQYGNEVDNTAYLIDAMQPGYAIGLWIQREIGETAQRSNEQMVQDYDDKKILETLEEVSLLINYNLVNGGERSGYSQDYQETTEE